MKRINHNIIKPLQSIIITLGIVGVMMLSGVIDSNQAKESQALSQEIMVNEAKPMPKQDNEYKYKNGELITPDYITIFDTLCVMNCDSLNACLLNCECTDEAISNCYYAYCVVN